MVISMDSQAELDESCWDWLSMVCHASSQSQFLVGVLPLFSGESKRSIKEMRILLSLTCWRKTPSTISTGIWREELNCVQSRQEYYWGIEESMVSCHLQRKEVIAVVLWSYAFFFPKRSTSSASSIMLLKEEMQMLSINIKVNKLAQVEMRSNGRLWWRRRTKIKILDIPSEFVLSFSWWN